MVYDLPPGDGMCLAQGEILKGVWEHRPDPAPVELPAGAEVKYASHHHPVTLVLNPYCDLYWDHELRFPKEGQGEAAAGAPPDHKLVPFVLLCDVFKEEEIKARGGLNSDLMKRIRKNLEPRYHFFEGGDVGPEPKGALPGLYLDFKRVFVLPTERLYDGLTKGVERIASIPDIYREDLMVRFGYFLARVSLPD